MNKEEIINKYSKREFMDFLEYDNNATILKLFDKEGLSILAKSPLKTERLRYILTYSPYIDDLFLNHQFLDLFLSCDISNFYACLKGLSFATAKHIITYCLKNNYSLNDIALLISYFTPNFQIQYLDTLDIPHDLIYEIFKKTNSVQVKNKIIQKYTIDLLSHNINLESFLDFARESVLKASKDRHNNIETPEIKIPQSTFTKEFCHSFWFDYVNCDPLRARKLMNDLAYCSNPDVLENYITTKEDSFILSSQEEIGKPFDSPLKQYLEYSKLSQELLNSKDINHSTYSKYLLNRQNLIIKLSKLTDEEITKENLDNQEYIINLITKTYHNTISNYIIDYHFKENYYNIMLDLQELMHFYYDGNIVIPKERIELYRKF